MRITVHAKPGAKRAAITKVSSVEYTVSVVERPERGKATLAVRRALAAKLKIPQSRLSLVKGHSSRTKVFEIL